MVIIRQRFMVSPFFFLSSIGDVLLIIKNLLLNINKNFG